MGAHSGPNSVIDGLVLAVDAANPEGNRYPSNSLAQWPWRIGVGSETGFGRNGTDAENNRVVDTNPFGNQDIVWQSPSNDIESNSDGGWNGSTFAIDPTKMYRFSTWVRKKTTVGNGRYYLGLYGGNDSSSNIGVRTRSDDVLSTNHYFHALRFDTDLSSSVSVNEWVLGVGHVWPEGSGAGSNHPDSGIWDLSGNKINSSGDAYWETGSTIARHRSYQFYSTTTNEIQQWWHPRVDVIDGTEPSIQQLLNGVGSNWNLIEKQNFDLEGAHWDSNSFVYNGTDGISRIDATNFDFSTEQTIIMILKPEESDGNRRNPYNQSYGGYGTITHEPSGVFNYYHGTNGSNGSPYQGTNSSFTVAENETAMICLTRNASTVSWYKNGEFNRSEPNSYPTASSSVDTILIGDGYTNKYIGKIYHIFLYTRALSAAEIKQNFEALRSRYNL